MGRKIAYVMSRFPHLPETFILREMRELEKQGWQIALYPLIRQRQTVIHADAKPWIQRVRETPFVSVGMLAANGRALVRQPTLYASLWRDVLWQNRTNLNYLVRAIGLFPKAVLAARLMQAEGVSHIHAHYASHPALVAWIIHRLTGIRYSITVHAHDIFVRQAMLAAKLRDAAFIVAISDFNREYLADLVGSWVRGKTHVIHCGIEPDKYAPRQHAPRPGGRFEIISVGSLQPYKGQQHLIRACALLRDQGTPLRCRIIGGGEERAGLERLIAAMGLEQIVELLGPLPQAEVARLLPTAHCYVQPSVITPAGKMEGIPVSLMEAFICALPVVASDLSGIPELVRPGQTGYLAPPADAPALADALTTVYANYGRAAQLALAGRALILRQFELQTNVKRLASLFEKNIQIASSPVAANTLAFNYLGGVHVSGGPPS